MKRSSILAAIALTLSLGACSPQTFTMNLETRLPSLSGFDLGGKSLSVVYLEEAGKDTVFAKNLATGFAEALEKDYFGGRQAVGVYRMEKKSGADYASRDTLLNLVMDSGDDVIFLFDAPAFQDAVLGEQKTSSLQSPDSSRFVVASIPYSLRMYAYDSMNKADTVRTFVGNGTFNQVIFGSEKTTDAQYRRHLWDNTTNTAVQAADAGNRSAAKFKSVWKEEMFTFFYYDSAVWTDAAESAYVFKWNTAVDKWMSLLNTKNYEKRAYAEYNLAVACFLMGDVELASRWLDQSDKDGKVYLSDNLRRKIAAKLTR
ncbi:MAG: hypothetical protein IJ578_08580 [Bacteroidales bacterium]|nr:hypothetical protein [Bacteroidales bacterium]